MCLRTSAAERSTIGVHAAEGVAGSMEMARGEERTLEDRLDVIAEVEHAIDESPEEGVDVDVRIPVAEDVERSLD